MPSCKQQVTDLAEKKKKKKENRNLVDAVGLNSKLPSESLGGVRLGAVLGQLALVVVTHSRLRKTQTAEEIHEPVQTAEIPSQTDA